MQTLTQILKEAVQKLPDSVFLRATDSDANISIDEIDLRNRTVFIYHNLPRVVSTVQRGGLVQENWPTEIDVLQLAEFDDTTIDGDVLRNNCKILADSLMDQLKIRNDSVTPLANYENSFSEAVQVHDKILTGVRLRFNWIFDRTTYNCG